ncbi:phospholipase A1 member A-like [Parasteatoda tepidariorum]|uniref:phospholipase A1 member A-like n=1 Tax=Parasteatoda tepidariorum TaxID=114398 RepID=UPI00077FB1B3|nr:phospholipase A1 member A-like [Parasteatoda tepidariorum]
MLTFTILFLAFFGNMPSAATSFINEVKCYLADLNYFFFGSKNENIKYLFYSRTNPLDPCDLQPTTDALDTCKFNSSLDTKVLLHGWIAGLPPASFLFPMKDDILDVGNFNVIIVNWTSYTGNTDNGLMGYSESAIYSMYVGRKVSAWVAFLQRYAGADPKKFHFIPFSMGSEVTSFAAKTMCNLNHITFLDPAAPLFRFLPSFLGPSYMDADFVEAMHTDAASNGLQGYGFIRPVAGIDYYPNGGNLQPKCQENATFYYGDGSTGKVTDMGTSISCKHNSAFIYYLASFNKNCQFIGLICESYDDYLSGKCSATNTTVCKMGYYSRKIENLPPYSKCYLQTSAYPPYCLN